MESRTTHCFVTLATLLLATAAAAGEFDLPALDEGKIRTAGIRKLGGNYITLYTDQPPAVEIDELPQVFDAAVPKWCAYFGIDVAKVAGWKIVGSVMQERARFEGAGL